LKQANALGFTQAVIIGEEELRTGSVVLRDMAQGEQAQLSLEEAIRKLKG
jgi:histidyl-tRNA synthetase